MEEEVVGAGEEAVEAEAAEVDFTNVSVKLPRTLSVVRLPWAPVQT